jgi:hypothetical protein
MGTLLVDGITMEGTGFVEVELPCSVEDVLLATGMPKSRMAGLRRLAQKRELRFGDIPVGLEEVLLKPGTLWVRGRYPIVVNGGA